MKFKIFSHLKQKNIYNEYISARNEAEKPIVKKKKNNAIVFI